MNTSLLTQACVLLCLATPLAAVADDTPATAIQPAAWQGQVSTALPEPSYGPSATLQPASLAVPKLTLNQALRAANLAAPSLKPPADWLALFNRLGHPDTDSLAPMPDSTHRPAPVMLPG